MTTSSKIISPASDKRQLSDNKRELIRQVIIDHFSYALFQNVGINFLKNRNNPDAFEPAPGAEPEKAEVTKAPTTESKPVTDVESYRVSVNGTQYDVVVGPGDADISQITSAPVAPTPAAPTPVVSAGPANVIKAPLAGTVIDILVNNGQQVNDGDAVIILEAMKMETEIRSSFTGSVQNIMVSKGDSIQSDQDLIAIG